MDPGSIFSILISIAAPSAYALLLGWKDNINGVRANIPPTAPVTLVAIYKNFLLPNLLINPS